MVYPYIRNTFNPNKISPDNIYSATLDDFSGGINNRVTPMLLNANEAVDIYNMSFVSDGVEKRTGTSLYDDVPLDGEIVYMDLYKPINLPEVLIRATLTSVYANNTKIKTVTGKIQGVSYIGNYYFVDGTNYYVYDGTNVYTIKQPTEQYLASNAASGTAVLTIKEWDSRIVVGMDIQIEGISGVETGKISDIDATAKTVTLTSDLTLGFVTDELVRFYIPRGVSYFEGVYKTDETLKLKWYEPCSHELDDDFKGECYIPKQCTRMAYDSERLFIAGDKDNPNEIYLSDINNPFYFPVTLVLQCPPNGDKIIDLVHIDDAIVVGRSNDIHVIYGTTSIIGLSNVFTLKRFDTHTGFASPNNAKAVNNYLFYMGSDANVYGMHNVYNNENILATTMINQKKVDFLRYPFSLSYSDIANCPSIYYNDEYWFIAKNMIIVYNYIKQSWTRYLDINASFFLIKDNVLLIGTSDGTTLKTDKTYNDSGVAIRCYYKTGQQNLNKAVNFKNFQDMFAVTHVYDVTNSSIKIMALVDFDEISTSTDVFNQLSQFGVTKFGDKLIGTNIAQTDYIPINIRGRIISFVFSNEKLDEPMKVYQISCTYILRGTR